MGKRFFICVLMLAGMVLTAYGKNMYEDLESARQQPFDGVGIVAHRGYWNCEAGGFARNSLAALKAAQDAGFWGSEFDVNMTADSVLIVFHDSSIQGKRIEKNPLSEFADFLLENGETIPTLEQYLAQAQQSDKTTLVFEMKAHSSPQVEDEAIRRSLALLKQYGLLDPKRVIFISFSLHACREFARLCPGFTVQYLGANLWPSEVRDNGINGIDMNFFYYLLAKRFHDEARNLGMSINVWTVNKEQDMQTVIDTGIDLITTDEPMAARKILAEKEVRKF